MFKGVLPLYRWTIRAKIYKWYKQLDEIEKVATSTEETLKKNQEDLLSLKDEVQAHTKVPLSYKGEYYNLLLHIDLVAKELKLQKKV